MQAYPGPVVIEWPEGRKLRVNQVTSAKMNLRVGQERDWFNIDGTIALDEDQLLEPCFKCCDARHQAADLLSLHLESHATSSILSSTSYRCRAVGGV